MACIPQGFTLTCPLPSYIVRLFGVYCRILVRLDLHTALGHRLVSGVPLLSSLFLVSSGGDWLAHGRAQTRGGGEERKQEEEGGQERRGREPLRESDVTCSGASLRCSRLRVGSFMQRLVRDIKLSRVPTMLQLTCAAGSALFVFLPSFLIRPQGRYELLHPRRRRVYVVAKALIPMFGILNESARSEFQSGGLKSKGIKGRLQSTVHGSWTHVC
ncbi:hypothetical protein B0H14DRAFT_31312 [Mycena olivaceomarginata]|nr:hypothetical protein B0H14DRAFT_31312 [Mycena olivaceomarginata]